MSADPGHQGPARFACPPCGKGRASALEQALTWTSEAEWGRLNLDGAPHAQGHFRLCERPRAWGA